MLHATILAGGLGSRLWPASRIAKPKHLLAFEPPHTLLQATLERLTGLVPPEQTWIVTSKSQFHQIADSLPTPYVDTRRILSEPFARNTAASIGWAALKLCQVDPDATMIVLPADHIIKPASVFCETLQVAANIVEQSSETLVTLGIKPTFPATTYGYIECGATWEVSQSPHAETGLKCQRPRIPARQRRAAEQGRRYEPDGHLPPDPARVYHVLRFCEKPKQEIAESFFRSGNFYWNAGIFVWKAATILELLHHFEPDIGVWLDQIAASLGTPNETFASDEVFQNMKSLSIDYAVMERAKKIAVVEASFDWNDVGTWSALDRLYANQKDKFDNLAISSQMLAIDSTGCTVRCENADHLVALVGLHDVVVIQTANATLIARKDQEESVRRIVEELNKQQRDQWL